MARSIPFDLERHPAARNARWTVAALINDEVVAFEQFDVGATSDLNHDEVVAAKNRLSEHPELVAAETDFENRMPSEMEERLRAIEEMDESEIPDFRVCFGMLSGGVFSFGFNKIEAKKLRISHLW